MPLTNYRGIRNFAKTPEPAGRMRRSRRRSIFVVQKHDASRLHYDFRLATNGVLASWAVPKGPSMNPADKRLAVRTEDHPLEYANFEGVIPAGEYGAGAVMVWDLGGYESPENQPIEAQLARGKIHVALQGEKLHGGFALVKIERRSSSSSRSDYWLLIKSRDEYADSSWDVESPRFDYSVLTGRSLEEIKQSKPGKGPAAAKRHKRPVHHQSR